MTHSLHAAVVVDGKRDCCVEEKRKREDLEEMKREISKLGDVVVESHILEFSATLIWNPLATGHALWRNQPRKRSQKKNGRIWQRAQKGCNRASKMTDNPVQL